MSSAPMTSLSPLPSLHDGDGLDDDVFSSLINSAADSMSGDDVVKLFPQSGLDSKEVTDDPIMKEVMSLMDGFDLFSGMHKIRSETVPDPCIFDSKKLCPDDHTLHCLSTHPKDLSHMCHDSLKYSVPFVC